MTKAPAWTLAIDYGTTHTCAAVAVEGKDPELIEIDGLRRLPSLIVVGSEGKLLTGKVAANQFLLDPRRGERTPKRHIGQLELLLLGDSAVSIVDAIAAVLSRVLEEAKRRFDGAEPSRVALTHPVRWESKRVDVLRKAAEKAGLKDPAFLKEPVAAALHFAADRKLEDGAKVAVYDLGGGTYDTAVLRADVGAFEIIGVPGGDPNIGGERFDEALVSFVGEQIEEVDPDLWAALLAPDAPREVQQDLLDLRTRIREAKEALSHETSLPVHVKAFERSAKAADRDHSIQVTRAQFEELIGEDIADTVEEMARTLAEAGVKASDLAALYMTGDSSRIPAIRSALTLKFAPLEPSNWDDPKAVVALGATRYASLGRAVEPIVGTAAERLAKVGAGLYELLEADGQSSTVARLKGIEARAAKPGVSVVVVGETKRGKSSLINALVGRDEVLPVDADVATSTYLEVGYAAKDTATVFTADAPEGISIGLEEIGEWGSMEGNPINDKEVSHVRVGLNSPILERGLTLIDTPGVGGLVAGHKQITLATLSLADALLLVVDANAPLSRPELDFLAEATERIETVIVAQTKKDLFAGWKTIRDDNLALIAKHAPRYAAAPIVAVASPMVAEAAEARADGDAEYAAELEADSGFAELTAEINVRVIERAAALRQANLCRGLLSAAEGLERREQKRLRSIQGDPALEAELEAAQNRCAATKSRNAGWRASLDDELDKLQTQTEREIRRVVDETLRRATEVLAVSGPDVLRQIHRDLSDALDGHWMDVQRSTRVGMEEIAGGLVRRLADEGFHLDLGALPNSELDMEFDDAAAAVRVQAIETQQRVAKPKRSKWGWGAVLAAVAVGVSGVLSGGATIVPGLVWLGGGGLGAGLLKKGDEQRAALASVRNLDEAQQYVGDQIAKAQKQMSTEIATQIKEARHSIEGAVTAFVDARDKELKAELKSHQARAKRAKADREAEEAAVRQGLATLAVLRTTAESVLNELIAAPAAPTEKPEVAA